MDEQQQEQELVDQAAATVRRWGLETPVHFLLDAGHPFQFLCSQLLWVAQPALSLIIPATTIRGAATLLEDPAAQRSLAAKLEMSEAQER